MSGTRKHRTITRQDLAQAVTKAAGVPRTEAADLVGQFFGLISDAVLRGEPVLLSGFGKFAVVPRAPRRARNVRAGHEIMVGPRLAVVFKPAVGLVQHLTAAAKLEERSAKASQETALSA